jgi:hypothetical protein
MRLIQQYPALQTRLETRPDARSPKHESENLVPLALHKRAAQVRVCAEMVIDVGKAVGVILWLVYLATVLISGHPIVLL